MKFLRCRNAAVFSTFAWLLSVVAVPVQAASNLHIGSGYGTACVTGGCPLYNGEVNALNSGSKLDIYFNAANGGPLNQPLLLILAVPNNTPSTNLFGTSPINAVTFYQSTNAVAFTTGSASAATAGIFGLKAPNAALSGGSAGVTGSVEST